MHLLLQIIVFEDTAVLPGVGGLVAVEEAADVRCDGEDGAANERPVQWPEITSMKQCPAQETGNSGEDEEGDDGTLRDAYESLVLGVLVQQ